MIGQLPYHSRIFRNPARYANVILYIYSFGQVCHSFGNGIGNPAGDMFQFLSGIEVIQNLQFHEDAALVCNIDWFLGFDGQVS